VRNEYIVNQWFCYNETVWGSFYTPKSTTGPKPQGPDKGDKRVLRGGVWFNGPEQTRVTLRNYTGERVMGDAIGFRCAWSRNE
jgi:formylglycine-generating enzyme required for sulfatase activity